MNFAALRVVIGVSNLINCKVLLGSDPLYKLLFAHFAHEKEISMSTLYNGNRNWLLIHFELLNTALKAKRTLKLINHEISFHIDCRQS